MKSKYGGLMKELDIHGLIKKAEELRALFILGQRVVPFLEELFSFVGEIQPLLEEINTSIKDNLSKMPNLSKQLSKVTEATELATNEILDIVDGVFYKLDILNSNLIEIEKQNNSLKNIYSELKKLIEENINNSLSLEELIKKLQSLQVQVYNSIALESYINSMKEMIENIRNDSTSIMLSLQVQDITSQQIAAVNHLLNTVQSKLNSLLNKFQPGEIGKMTNNFSETTNVSELHRVIAFDPDAVESLSGNSARQDEIDKLFEQKVIDENWNEKIVEKNPNESQVQQDSDEKISQSDIDLLFNQNTQNP